MKNQKAHVSEEKKKVVNDLTKLMDKKNTIMITSIKGLPAKQFQKIKKNLSKDTEVRIVKKRAFIMAVEKTNKEGLKKLKEFAKEDIAILISDKDVFDLSLQLSKSKSPVKAKGGQISPQDIEIESGPTDLPAGPAVSELGGIGLTVKISAGKIEILESRVVVKKGGIISEQVASVMGKLDIMPFSVGFIPLVAYDTRSNIIFEDLTIDPEETLNTLKEMFAKSRAFAVSLGYVCKETIGLLLSKGESHRRALEKYSTIENTQNENESKSEELK